MRRWDIAGVIGRRLNVPIVALSPEHAAAHFGAFARFAGIDVSASSERTRALLGWAPSGPGLLADLEAGHYFGNPPAEEEHRLIAGDGRRQRDRPGVA